MRFPQRCYGLQVRASCNTPSLDQASMMPRDRCQITTGSGPTFSHPNPDKFFTGRLMRPRPCFDMRDFEPACRRRKVKRPNRPVGRLSGPLPRTERCASFLSRQKGRITKKVEPKKADCRHEALFSVSDRAGLRCGSKFHRRKRTDMNAAGQRDHPRVSWIVLAFLSAPEGRRAEK